jgi:hypothetical protein
MRADWFRPGAFQPGLFGALQQDLAHRIGAETRRLDPAAAVDLAEEEA